MPTLVIVRLRPSKPATPAAFTQALTGLTITAFDLTFGNTQDGVPLGSAGTLHPLNDTTIDLTNDGVIIQHHIDLQVPNPNGPPVIQRRATSAATAVLVAEVPPGHPEYPAPASFDLRLRLDRGGPIADHRLDIDATVTTVPALPTDANAVVALPPSAYATIPPANLGVGGPIQLPDDGTPPPFTTLVTAINAVLALDPADGTPLGGRGQLSPAQSLHVARELVWDRTVYPPPPEPRPLAEMYTDPPVVPGLDPKDAENDRERFEAELDGYYATRDAEAAALSVFVFSASAAMLCERLSAGEDLPGAGPAGARLDGAREALLPFPLPPGGDDGTTLTHTAVLLTGAPAGDVLDPPFVVPAAFFYALAAQLPPQVDAGQRYAMARADTEAKLLTAIQAAQDIGVLGANAARARRRASRRRRSRRRRRPAVCGRWGRRPPARRGYR